MSTHNIGFYEDLTKIIFELSSNIIKYAHYFFCCFLFEIKASLIPQHKILWRTGKNYLSIIETIILPYVFLHDPGTLQMTKGWGGYY